MDGRGVVCSGLNRTSNALLVCVFVCCHAAFGPPMRGQVTAGSLSGYVYDPSGRSIQNARVHVADGRNFVVRQTTTDSSGLYRLVGLPPAVYVVVSSAPGFEEVKASDVRLTVHDQVRVDFHLPIAGRREAIEVTVSRQSLSTETSELSTVLSRERIENLPLNRRDFLRLALLSPGVMPSVEDSELSSRGGFAMHANGGREEYNNFLLDGVDNNDPYVNRYALQPSVDAIQEFRIATNSYGAEYGRSAAGQVNVVTRGGTNELHGAVYEYLRNRALDARNYFDAAGKPKFVRNQLGFGLGGPMRRDRTFFFGNADFLRERRSLSRLAAVPSAPERRGDFSGTGQPVIDLFTGKPFPGNTIPEERFSPVARRVIELFPLPNLPGSPANYLAQPVLSEDVSQINGRLDHRMTEASQLMVRYSYGLLNLFEPYAEEAGALPGFGDFVRDAGHNATMQYQHTLGARGVNSLRFGFGRFSREILPENHTTDVGRLWGVDWLRVQPKGFGYPAFSVAGYSRLGDATSLPVFRHTNTYQIMDGLSIVRGAHTLKIGGEIRHLQLDSRLDLFTRGSMSFSGALTGSGMSDLLLGLVTFGIQANADNPIRLRNTAYNLYFQDDWKVRPDFTLNLGMRYEYNTPPTDPHDAMSTLNPRTGQVVRVGTEGISRSGIRPDQDNFAPRVGFAWSAAPKLVVRGGYGLYYDSGMFVVNSAQYFNPPQFNLRVFFPTETSLLTLANPFPSSGGFTPPPSLNLLGRDMRTSYLQQWSFSIQRPLGVVGDLSVAYAGSKGTGLIRSRDLNQPRPGPGEVQLRRPNLAYGSMFYVESGANSNFHSLQTTFSRPMSRNVSLWVVYTFSKSIDDSSAFLGTRPDKNFPQDSYNYRAERAVSSFDVRHRMTMASIYTLPGNHWLSKNTEFRGIVMAQSGQPFTPILRFDNSNTGNTGGTFGSDRPDLLRDPVLAHPTAERWFDTGAFRIPQRYAFGSSGRNVVRGDYYFSFDLSVARGLQLAERVRLLCEVQAFNLFNQTNFDLPEMFADEPGTFGRIFSAKPSRQLQFALRLQF